MSAAGNLRTARNFLAAYWHADLAAALTCCLPDASIELAPSLPLVTPAPIAAILPMIFRDVYPRFEGGRFETTIEETLADEARVLIEYVAKGRLAGGGLFDCRYAAVLTLVGERIARLRMYTDTRYVAAALMS